MGRNLEERDALNEGLDEVIEDITIQARIPYEEDFAFAETPAERASIQNEIACQKQNSLKRVRSVIRAL